MKINLFTEEPAFKPFTLSLTVETHEEAAKLFAIFINPRNSEFLGTAVCEQILDKIGAEFPDFNISYPNGEPFYGAR